MAWAYEAGVRSTLADGKAAFNVAGFFYDYDGLQVNQFSSTGAFGQAVLNALGAEVFGVEVEISANLPDYFTLGGHLSNLAEFLRGAPKARRV